MESSNFYAQFFEPQNPEHQVLLQQGSNFWRDRWERISRLKKLPFNANILLEKDFALFIKEAKSDQIACMLSFRFLVPEKLKNENAEILSTLEEPFQFFEVEPKSTVVIFETNCIASAYSLRKTGIPLVKFMVKLGAELSKDWQADWCLGISRTLTGVQDTGESLGFRSFPKAIVRSGFPVSVQMSRPSEIANLKSDEAIVFDQIMQHPKTTKWRSPNAQPNRKAA